MKKILYSLLLVAIPLFSLKAQNTVDPYNQVLTSAEVQPKFDGDMNKYLVANIKYPAAEKKAYITGTVYVTFIIEKDGSVSNVKVLRGVPRGPGLDAEAVRVISTMPNWIPGRQDGQPARVQFTIPIHFQLM